MFVFFCIQPVGWVEKKKQVFSTKSEKDGGNPPARTLCSDSGSVAAADWLQVIGQPVRICGGGDVQSPPSCCAPHSSTVGMQWGGGGRTSCCTYWSLAFYTSFWQWTQLIYWNSVFWNHSDCFDVDFFKAAVFCHISKPVRSESSLLLLKVNILTVRRIFKYTIFQRPIG